MNKKIIVDICGADKAPQVLIKGTVDALKEQNEYDLVIVGPKSIIEEAFADCDDSIKARAQIIDCDGVVTNHDNPKLMVKGREDTTMGLALKMLKENDDIVGMVSPGSTGSLMIGSIFRLGIFKGLMQPALSSALRNVKGEEFCLVDCGANVNSKTKDLLDYAHMGSAFMEAMNNIESPRVGLVNVGKEKGKGNDLMKEAYEALEADETINFIGNLEGSDVLLDEADVIVCDGFTGNVILKNLEATGMVCAKITGYPEKILRLFDYNAQGGATFLGTKKIIVKAHGNGNDVTIKACIMQTARLADGGFIEKMAARMK